MRKNKEIKHNQEIKLAPRNPLPIAPGTIRPFGHHRSMRRRHISIDESGPGIIRLEDRSGVVARVYSKLYGKMLIDNGAIELRANLERNGSYFDPDGYLEWGEKDFEVRSPEQPVPSFKYRVVIDYSGGLKAEDLKIIAEFPGNPSERVLSVRDYLIENRVEVVRVGGRDGGYWVY